ncbi:mitochondrial carrier protein [Nitzschia inconspicua]|uniref:Mitochondrial carrier protein n=1 Tax=Nitzschia inconspicua TaxID=303405 RepID=A0A9K3KQ72_9STRA|nr:mitochondrial carrier protein [Nitzschia inconspicua]
MNRFSATKAALFAVWLILPRDVRSLQIVNNNKKNANHRLLSPTIKPATTTSSSSSTSSSRHLSSVSTSVATSTTTVAETYTDEEKENVANTVNALTLTASNVQRRTLSRLSMSEPEIWKLALAGSLATLVSDVTMHPLDCIKTLQQTE